jgi:catechol 2,3-dioxygenase-like lactoylglutathione lyase family enzyme
MFTAFNRRESVPSRLLAGRPGPARPGLAGALVALAILALSPSASAQLLPLSQGPIVYGHHHLNTTNIEAFRKFWAETLGGTLVRIGTDNLEIVRFPGAVMFVRPMQAPTGGSVGSSVDHLGFSVPDLRRVLDRAKAGGYRIVTAQSVPSGVTVRDDIGQVTAPGVSGIAYVMSPDEVKVELVEIKGQQTPIASHHVHFFVDKPEELRDWYVKVFAARAAAPVTPGVFRVELPGIGLNFSAATGAVGTRGRALDHIGFEVDHLDEFAARLAAQGIMTTIRSIPAIKTKVGFVTDPAGTLIELSEGLRAIP